MSPRSERIQAAALSVWTRTRTGFLAGAHAVWGARAELAASLALLGGWALVTLGIAALTSPLAWAFSGGVLLLSGFGWKLLYTIARDGLYHLTQSEGARRG